MVPIDFIPLRLTVSYRPDYQFLVTKTGIVWLAVNFDNHLTTHSLLSDRQWGFRKGHSTESLLLHLTEVWKEALDNGLKEGVLFIDFKKAFDCVDHIILGEKLKALRVSEDMWVWLMDYLANRSQLTQTDGASWESKPVKIGVPQGSLFTCMLTTLPFIPLVILLMRLQKSFR